MVRLPTQFTYAYHKTFNDECSAAMLNAGSRLELDFTRVEYLDSSALGMLVLLNKKAADKNIKITIKGARGTAQEVLIMANMQKLFEIT